MVESDLDIVVDKICFSLNKTDQILRDVSLRIPKGGIYSLLGPSGCGKTTLLKCILGCYIPNSGDVTVFGEQLGSSQLGIPGVGVGYMPQDVALYDYLSIRENLKFYAIIYGVAWKEIEGRIDNLVAMLSLPDKNRQTDQLSGGERRRVSFAMTLIHRPPLLILDEPTVGVDPILREIIWKYLVTLSNTMNTTIILTTHYIEEARRSHRVGFMRKGDLICEDTPSNLTAKYEVPTLEQVFLKLCYDSEVAKKFGEDRKQKSSKIVSLMSTGIDSMMNYTPLNLQQSVRAKRPSKTFWDSIGSWLLVTYILTWKNLTINIRKPWGLGFQITFPVLVIVMICLIIGGPPFDVRLGIVNEDTDPLLSDLFIEKIDDHSFHKIYYDGLPDALQAVKTRDLWGVIHIKPNFTEAMSIRLEGYDTIDELTDATIDQTIIKIHADLTNKLVSIASELSLLYSYKNFVVDAYRELQLNPLRGEPPVDFDETIYGSLDQYYDMRPFFIPGILIGVMTILCIASTIFVMSKEIQDLMFHRNFVAGVTSSQVFVSHTITYTFLMSISMLILLKMTFFIFDINYKGSLVLIIILLFLMTLTSMTFGIMLSCTTKNTVTALCLAIVIGLTITVTGGIIWPLEAMPKYTRWLAYINPVTFPAEALRCIILKGWPLSHPVIRKGFTSLGIWMFALVIFDLLLFRFNSF